MIIWVWTGHLGPEHGDHRMLMTVKEFCESHRICRATFYELLRAGKGPRLSRIGSRSVRISAEAAAEWRRSLEVPPRRPVHHPA